MATEPKPAADARAGPGSFKEQGSTTPAWCGRHLLSASSLGANEIRSIFDRALAFEKAGDVTHDTLKGVRVANLFFEDSTRTRLSFAMATQRLGGTTADLFGPGSSVSKGETLADTARTVVANGAHVVVTRTKEAGAPGVIARGLERSGFDAPVINAGDGRHQHPTQGLLDAYAWCRARGDGTSWDLSGATIAIVGDLANSRVVRSDIGVMSALGARVLCVGPCSLVPEGLAILAKGPGSCELREDLDAVLASDVGSGDAVQALRIQFERHSGGVISSPGAYRARFGITEERAARMNSEAFVMHPGPFNRGLEIDGPVADGLVSGGPRSLILRQVEAGCFVRMAILAMAVGR